MQLAETGTGNLGGLVTLRVPLAEGPRAFEALVRRDGIKTVIEPGAPRTE